MEKQKAGKLNILGSLIAFCVTVYVLVIYILLMVGDTPGCIAFEMTTDFAGDWAYRFVLVILMYICCAVNIISIPAYFALKTIGSKHPARKYFGIAQITSSIVMLVLAIMFWATFGLVFNGSASTPFGTGYRIMEIILIPVMIGMLFLTVLYTPGNDMLKQIKKKYNKI